MLLFLYPSIFFIFKGRLGLQSPQGQRGGIEVTLFHKGRQTVLPFWLPHKYCNHGNFPFYVMCWETYQIYHHEIFHRSCKFIPQARILKWKKKKRYDVMSKLLIELSLDWASQNENMFNSGRREMIGTSWILFQR